MRFLHTNRRITSYPAYERFNNNYRAEHPVVDGLLGWYRTDYMNTDQVTNNAATAGDENYEGITRIHNRWGSLSDLVPATDSNGNKLYPSVMEWSGTSRRIAKTYYTGSRKYLLENDETIETPLTLTVAWHDPDVAFLIYSDTSEGTTIECDSNDNFIIDFNSVSSTISTDGGFNMISFVWDGGYVRLWVDGTDMGTSSTSNKYQGEVFNGNAGNDDSRYGANVAEWIFHDRALTSSEIQQEHNRMRAYFTGDRDDYHRRNYS